MSDYTGGEDGYSPLMGASRNFVDVNTLARHENPNYEGTPTQFFDDQGNLKAILADLVGSGQHPVDPYSYNPVLKEGEKLSADTARQATNEENQLLFLDNEGNQTTRNTGKPLVGGTLRDVMYEKDPGSRGGILPKDAYQAAALFAVMASAGTLGPAFLAAEGATAFPVASGALLPATELGAVGTGTVGAGAVGAGVGAGLTNAEAAALMGSYEPGALGGFGATGAGTGLTAADALKYGKMALSGASVLGGLAGGAKGTPGGTPGGSQTSNVAYNSNGPWNAPINPGMFTTGLQRQTPVTDGTEHLKMLFPELDPALARQFAMSGNTGSNLGGNYFAYGSSLPSSSSPLSEVDMFPGATSMRVKDGGAIQGFRDGGAPHIPEFITGATGHYVKGRGDGQSDDIPAMLADGEYVFDADTVAQLGNGSSDAGAKVLDKMREALRHHKRSAPVDSIPPKAKSPLEYIKLGMKRK